MQALKSFGVYANNLAGSLLGKHEGFYDASNAPINFATVGANALLILILVFIIIIANCYGAARLSWCYNTFYGAGEAEKLLWALLCFFYSGIYYPFYALFLDPVCGRVAQRGGSKKL